MLTQWVRVMPRPQCRGEDMGSCPHPPDDVVPWMLQRSPGVLCLWCGAFAFEARR